MAALNQMHHEGIINLHDNNVVETDALEVWFVGAHCASGRGAQAARHSGRVGARLEGVRFVRRLASLVVVVMMMMMLLLVDVGGAGQVCIVGRILAASAEQWRPSQRLLPAYRALDSGVLLAGPVEAAAEAEAVAQQQGGRALARPTQVANGLFEASPEAIVHPNVDERIGDGVTHCQVVRYEPDVHDVLVLPDCRVHVADNNQRIEG